MLAEFSSNIKAAASSLLCVVHLPYLDGLLSSPFQQVFLALPSHGHNRTTVMLVPLVKQGYSFFSIRARFANIGRNLEHRETLKEAEVRHLLPPCHWICRSSRAPPGQAAWSQGWARLRVLT